MLFIVSGLVIFVILSITIRVIPHVINEPAPAAAPGNSVLALWVLAGIHLIILAVLIGKIALGHRYRRLNETGLSIPGIILILVSMPLMDAGGAFRDHNPDISTVAFLLAVCVLFDMLAGIIMILLPSGIPDKPDK
jgi:hypothetical protein